MEGNWHLSSHDVPQLLGGLCAGGRHVGLTAGHHARTMVDLVVLWPSQPAPIGDQSRTCSRASMDTPREGFHHGLRYVPAQYHNPFSPAVTTHLTLASCTWLSWAFSCCGGCCKCRKCAFYACNALPYGFSAAACLLEAFSPVDARLNSWQTSRGVRPEPPARIYPRAAAAPHQSASLLENQMPACSRESAEVLRHSGHEARGACAACYVSRA